MAAAVIALSISGSSAPGGMVVPSGVSGAQRLIPRVTGADSSGATDTQLPGRVTAKVAPETAAVSEREATSKPEHRPSGERVGDDSFKTSTNEARGERQLLGSVWGDLRRDSRLRLLPRPRSETCRSARIAAVFFRFRTWTHQELRDGRLASKSPIVAGKSCHWAKFAAREWQARAKSARRSFYRWLNEKRVPIGESELRAYINDDCLEEIIDRESAGTWSPTVRNYTDGRAYGLPQALPGYKMASAGADWETNPKTQIAWMRGYVNGRYGGSCAALAHHNANGWY